MQLLTILTLIFVAILVLVLAASLITIFVLLWRIGGKLEKVRDALATVRDETAPLEAPLQDLKAVMDEIAENVADASASHSEAEENLRALTGKYEPSDVSR